MTAVAAVAVLAALTAAALAVVFARLWRGEAAINRSLRTAAVDYESKFNAAHAAARLARSETAAARAELEAERRDRLVNEGDFEMRTKALRDAFEVQGRELAELRRELAELRRGRGPTFRP
jgi:hypothetical protein